MIYTVGEEDSENRKISTLLAQQDLIRRKIEPYVAGSMRDSRRYRRNWLGALTPSIRESGEIHHEENVHE